MKPTEPLLPADLTDKILRQLESIIVGKPITLKLALACLIARGHLLIEDIPGVGKTTLAQALAATLGLSFQRVQFTSDLLPADILGVSIFDTKAQAFRWHAGPIFTPVMLADEINRAPPKTQSALLEAMEERQVSIDGETRILPDPFFVIATQNPLEQTGAFPLPESQLDRFLMCIELGYPEAQAERSLLESGDRRSKIGHLKQIADTALLLQLQNLAGQVHVAAALLDYVQALLARSRQSDHHGLSPRAGLYLLAASRAWALLSGRKMVLPEDVQAVFIAVAAHRLSGVRKQGVQKAAKLLETTAIP